MPIHDWSRVKAGIFHDFHQAWITNLRDALNGGILPPDYYALGDQVTNGSAPDVLTLHSPAPGKNGGNGNVAETAGSMSAAVTVATHPPMVQFVQTLEEGLYAKKQTVLTIRHASSDDRVVAQIEIVSIGNKSSSLALSTFVEKAARTLYDGIHLLVVDLQQPTPRDPHGIHAVIWRELGGDEPEWSNQKPLTLSAYRASPEFKAFVQPVAVGDPLPDMPLFLTAEIYVPVPLETTYFSAFRGVPRRWKEVLEAP